MNNLIENNIPDSKGYNAYIRDKSFAKLLEYYCGKDLFEKIEKKFFELGKKVGEEIENLSITADKNPPQLIKKTRSGLSVNEILKHPDFKNLEKIAFGDFGLAAMSHRNGVFGFQEKLPPIIKYGLTFLFVQSEFGLCCPLSMTDSLTRTLKKFGNKDLVKTFFNKLTSQDMDNLFQGAMFMTEQEAGSDVGSIKTFAEQENKNWYLTGEKWFCSNPDADLAMVLARPKDNPSGTKGLSLFLLPKILQNGSHNSYEIIRLKDKLGGKSFASGEIKLNKAYAYLIGDPNQGFKQMTDMINMSRLSNGVRASGIMQRSIQESIYISQNRKAFDKKLLDLPLMQKQISKMLLLSEASRSMVFKTSKILEKADNGIKQFEKLFRVLTPLIKFRACRDARKVSGDAMEIRGGCGYIEEWSDARMLRDSHLGSIWEGTSNIVSLDAIRALKKEDNIFVLKNYLLKIISKTDNNDDLIFLKKITEEVFDFIFTEIKNDNNFNSRQVASALYYLCASIFLNEESRFCTTLTYRNKICKLLIQHKLMKRNPIESDDLDKSIIFSFI